jgi:tetratricopeptide (TPR) repeat protein
MRPSEFARALGRTVGRPQLSAGAVQTWESGEIQPPAEIVAAACELASQPIPVTSRPAPGTRRGSDLTAATRAATPTMDERLAADRPVDTAVVDLLRAHTNSFRLVDRQLGARVVFDQLTSHITQIEALCRHRRPPRTGRALAAALAEACTLAGWQALDLGQTSTAWSYYELAKSAAGEAGDPRVLAHATAEQAYVLVDSGQHEKAVEQVISAKAQIRRLPPRLAAWIYCAEAEIRAISADETGAQRSLDLAAARCPASPADPELPYLALDVVHLDRWRGSTLAELGSSAAVRQLSGALAQMDRSFTRAAAGLHSDLAVALARVGEYEEARHHMHRAQNLADEPRSSHSTRAASVGSIGPPT